MAPFAAPGHVRSDSMDTMATAELAGRAPMRSESGYGSQFASGAETPYKDGPSTPPNEMGGGGGYNVAAGAGSTYDASNYPRQQTYRPVNMS
jgi:hypothetical protein